MSYLKELKDALALWDINRRPTWVRPIAEAARDHAEHLEQQRGSTWQIACHELGERCDRNQHHIAGDPRRPT